MIHGRHICRPYRENETVKCRGGIYPALFNGHQYQTNWTEALGPDER
jgi:hypothetical protein